MVQTAASVEPIIDNARSKKIGFVGDVLAGRMDPLEQEIDRMRCSHGMLLLAVLIVGLVGCQGSTGDGEAPAPADTSGQSTADRTQATDGGSASGVSDETVPNDTSTPAAAVAVFLDAVRRGDDAKIMELYTGRAREEASRMNEHFAPKASDTARFEVGDVEFVADDGARVGCAWTDLDQNGQPHTMEFLWTLRREQPGWRVAGMVATPFPGENPVLFDFENLDQTIQKVNLLAEEVARREQRGGQQALEAKKSETPTLR